MDDKPEKPATQSKAAPKSSRTDRLKRALRENLKRRKSQSKGRSAAAAAGAEDDTSFHAEDCGKSSDPLL